MGRKTQNLSHGRAPGFHYVESLRPELFAREEINSRPGAYRGHKQPVTGHYRAKVVMGCNTTIPLIQSSRGGVEGHATSRNGGPVGNRSHDCACTAPAGAGFESGPRETIQSSARRLHPSFRSGGGEPWATTASRRAGTIPHVQHDRRFLPGRGNLTPAARTQRCTAGVFFAVRGGLHGKTQSVHVHAYRGDKSCCKEYRVRRIPREIALPQTAVNPLPHPTMTIQIGSALLAGPCSARMRASRCIFSPARQRAVATNTSRRNQHPAGSRRAGSSFNSYAQIKAALGSMPLWMAARQSGGATSNVRNG